MERDIMKDLLKWKNKSKRKPLLVRGARQVGKTWIIKEFAKAEFADQIYFVCDKKSEKLAGIFNGSLDPKRIIPLLELASGKKIKEETLLIFDEIQEIPRALESLKYFCEQAPDIPIVAAGSLMGIALHEGTSFPVGKVEEVFLYPMTFEEFLDANGKNGLRMLLESKDRDSVKALAGEYKELLKTYYLVGGMPEAVDCWIRNKDYAEVRSIQKGLLDFYDNDFSKHAPAGEIVKIRAVWSSLLKQLTKENRKFIYGLLRTGSRAKDYEVAINWLRDYGIIRIVKRVSKAGLPLKAYEDPDVFKIYMLDVGLMCAMGDLDPAVILEGSSIFAEFKGALTEQYVCGQLTAGPVGNAVYYWSADNSTGEVDFVVQYKNTVYPIEVKAEENLKAKSLKVFCDRYGLTGIRTSMSDYREQEWMTNVPLYMIGSYLL